MLLRGVSTTSTNIYFVLGWLNAIIFSFQSHVSEFISFIMFFGDISPICSTGRAIFLPIFFKFFVLQKGEILKINTKKIRKNIKNCQIGNILVEVVPEGCIYEIKLITLVLKHFSSKYSPTKEIWPPLLGVCVRLL